MTKPVVPQLSVQRALAAEGAVRVFEYQCLSPRGTPPQAEQFAWPAVSVVTKGVFGFRTGRATQLLTGGSLLLADPGKSYEVSHEHAGHDRCLIFRFDPSTFDRLAGAPPRRTGYFHRLTLPALPRLDALATLARRRIADRAPALGLEELGLALGTAALQLAGTGPGSARTDVADSPRTRDAVHAALDQLERSFTTEVTLLDLARAAGLSPFHFLRSFKRELGVTPYRYLVRRRLREALALLSDTTRPVTEVAFDAGFGDLSNFINTFRREIGCSPRQFRQTALGQRTLDPLG